MTWRFHFARGITTGNRICLANEIDVVDWGIAQKKHLNRWAGWVLFVWDERWAWLLKWVWSRELNGVGDAVTNYLFRRQLAFSWQLSGMLWGLLMLLLWLACVETSSERQKVMYKGQSVKLPKAQVALPIAPYTPPSKRLSPLSSPPSPSHET